MINNNQMSELREKELVSLNIKIATKDLVKRVDEKIVAVLPDIDLHSKISLRGKIIRLIAEESFTLISHERAEAIEKVIDEKYKRVNAQYLKKKMSGQKAILRKMRLGSKLTVLRQLKAEYKGYLSNERVK